MLLGLRTGAALFWAGVGGGPGPGAGPPLLAWGEGEEEESLTRAPVHPCAQPPESMASHLCCLQRTLPQGGDAPENASSGHLPPETWRKACREQQAACWEWRAAGVTA